MAEPSVSSRPFSRTRKWLYVVIFGSDTPLGKAFDVALILVIIASVASVMLDSVPSIQVAYWQVLWVAEWGFTVLFTIEYVLRLYCAPNPLRYARSFFGIVDLAAILPTYVSLFIEGSQYLLVVRLLRVLRVFRVLKIAPYLGEAEQLLQAMRASQRKITVFLFAVLTLTVIIGALMYMVEGEANGFTSIPKGMYWAIVTLTTVGYGDISPKTALGQAMASVIMIIGYGIIAVPTGIVTVELAQANRQLLKNCPACGSGSHEPDAVFCRHCGDRLEGTAPAP